MLSGTSIMFMVWNFNQKLGNGLISAPISSIYVLHKVYFHSKCCHSNEPMHFVCFCVRHTCKPVLKFVQISNELLKVHWLRRHVSVIVNCSGVLFILFKRDFIRLLSFCQSHLRVQVELAEIGFLCVFIWLFVFFTFVCVFSCLQGTRVVQWPRNCHCCTRLYYGCTYCTLGFS